MRPTVKLLLAAAPLLFASLNAFSKDTLNINEGLLANQYLQSSNGSYKLYLQGDGNVVLRNTPIQACVMNITDSQAEACEQVVAKLKENGLRAISDLRNEKIGFKIRERTLERIPYLLVLGDREVEEGTVNVRTRSGKNLGTMSVDAFIDLVKSAVAERGRYIVE